MLIALAVAAQSLRPTPFVVEIENLSANCQRSVVLYPPYLRPGNTGGLCNGPRLVGPPRRHGHDGPPLILRKQRGCIGCKVDLDSEAPAEAA